MRGGLFVSGDRETAQNGPKGAFFTIPCLRLCNAPVTLIYLE
jgi:hypothetical protein